jgi:peroxiredoxin
MHKTAGGLLGLILVWVVATAPGGSLAQDDTPKAEGPKKAAEEAVKVGDALPSFSLKTLNPEKSGRQMLATKRVVGAEPEEPVSALVISFASVYCKPCMKELPELEQFYRRISTRGVLVAVVDIDREEADIEKLKQMAVEKEFTFPLLSDRFALVARRYAANELPMILLADRAGKVRWIKTGYESGGLEELSSQIDLLLGPAPQPGAGDGHGAGTETEKDPAAK